MKKIIKHLNDTINSARQTKLYANKLDGVTEINRIEQIQDLPFTSKEDLRKTYPFGGLSIGTEHIVEMHTSSGTTGKPTLSFFSKKDLEESSKALSIAWNNFGISKKSRVQMMMSYGLFSGAALNTYAMQSLGAFVIPAGIQPTIKQIEMLKDFKVDSIVATPSYYLHLYDVMILNDIKISSLNLKIGIAAGEVYTNELKHKIEKLFDIRVFDHYGLCEINTGIIYECKVCGRMAVIKDYTYVEVIDPDTGKLLPDGSYGELVITSLKKEASPVIRYRTGDISKIITRKSKCINCKGSIVIDRIKNRTDSTIFYKGLKLNPSELKDDIIIFSNNKIINRIKIKAYYKEEICTRIKIIIALQSITDGKFVEELQNYLKNKVKVKFDIEVVPANYFKDFSVTKDKLVESIYE